MSFFWCVCSFQAPSYDSVLQTAQSIAQQAHDLAYDPNYMSPFAQFACDNGLNVRGTCTDSPVKTIESIQVFMNSSSGIKICLEMDLFIFLFLELPNLHNLTCFSLLAGGKPDDITVLLSIVAEYTD